MKHTCGSCHHDRHAHQHYTAQRHTECSARGCVCQKYRSLDLIDRLLDWCARPNKAVQR